MNHQITLEELGIIPKQESMTNLELPMTKNYTNPCGGCLCHHCANSVECVDNCTGESELSCFNCDECRYYDGKGTYNRKKECENYKVTNRYAEYRRSRLKIYEKPEG